MLRKSSPNTSFEQRSQPALSIAFVEILLFDISSDQVRLGEQTIPIAAHVDVLVCGGGVAGIAAAVAAARNGAKTLLIERAGFLGGTATGSAMGLIVIPASELVGFPLEFFSAWRANRAPALAMSCLGISRPIN